LGRLPPHVAVQEERLAVLPLAGLAVQVAGGGGDPELGHRRPRRGEAQLRIVGEVPDQGDGGVSCHGALSSSSVVPTGRWFPDRSSAEARAPPAEPATPV